MKILVVCTGNVCRSPYVAARLAQQFPDVDVEAAGTHAAFRAWPHPLILEELLRRQTPWRPLSRQLKPRMARDADLIITMTGAHRVEVLRRSSAAEARTFTLKELALAARSYAPAGAPDWHSLVAHAQAVYAVGGSDVDADLDDPYGGPDEGFAVMIEVVEEALGAIVAAIGSGTRP